ncbi:MAG: hypothetical protein BWY70_01288 [Bacteroidetes bacterium ADurb.Bin408]|nr:MAG: hypothetical protein BWY70_01288 [Bacteroidetes bacterium ADurb.Bin408]
MYRYAFIVCQINRRQGGTIINKGQPTGIAVGKDIYCGTFFLFMHGFNQRQTVKPDEPAEFSIFVSNKQGFTIGSRKFFCMVLFFFNHSQHSVYRPFEVDGCGAGLFYFSSGSHQIGIGLFIIRRLQSSQIHGEGTRGSYETGTSYFHIGNSPGHALEISNFFNDKIKGELSLVYNTNDFRVVLLYPYGAVVPAVDVHSLFFPDKVELPVADVYSFKGCISTDADTAKGAGYFFGNIAVGGHYGF